MSMRWVDKDYVRPKRSFTLVYGLGCYFTVEVDREAI